MLARRSTLHDHASVLALCPPVIIPSPTRPAQASPCRTQGTRCRLRVLLGGTGRPPSRSRFRNRLPPPRIVVSSQVACRSITPAPGGVLTRRDRALHGCTNLTRAALEGGQLVERRRNGSPSW